MSTDIRQWAADNGVALGSHGPVPKHVKAQFLEATGGQLASEQVQFEGEGPGAVTLDTGEQTPSMAVSQSPAEKIRSKFTRAKAVDGVVDRRPKRRVSSAGSLGWAWVGLANVAARSGFLPVGRVMEMQAPVAGVMLEQATKGTVVDKLIQPLCRGGEKGKIIGALIAPPFLVAAIQQRPALYPQLAPMLEECLYQWIEIAGPEVAKKAKVRAEREAQYGSDVASMMEAIFAPMVAEQQAQQEAERASMEQTEPEGRPRATRRRSAVVEGE